MNKVTSTILVHRPERILYYLPEVTKEENDCIANGQCPQRLKEYLYAFGTYDEVGVFHLTGKLRQMVGKDHIVGIEFRKNDNRVVPPSDLPSVILPACDMIIQDIGYEQRLDKAILDEIVNYVKFSRTGREELCRVLEGGMLVLFLGKEKLRVMCEVELLEKRQCVSCDTSEKYTKEDLYKRAFYEPITDFYNWRWMCERLMSYYHDGIKDYAFVHFDIKDFKMVNELFNHYVGNMLLKRVAKNMENHKDWIYFGARCDNDNFAMMIKDMPEKEIMEKLEDFFEEISVLEEEPTYRIYYRCGVVTMRYAMNSGDIVADCAKLAQSMGTGINTTEIHFYTKEMHDELLWGKQLKAYLHTAIQGDEFLVYLQPKMNILQEKICGAEALVRWNYKHKELMSPIRFIPHFEQDDSIIKVDEWVLHRVCSKLKEWREKGYPLFPISVNLSRKHLQQKGVANHLAEIVDSYAIPRELIEFELTENSAESNQEYMIAIMNELKEKGFQISMDDFGTGYSSFGLLKEMPLDTLKIDKSFVDLVAKGEGVEKTQIILRHIISMTKELGLQCIAEGAQDYEQICALRDLGCQTVQGFYYSKPVSMSEFEEQYMK